MRPSPPTLLVLVAALLLGGAHAARPDVPSVEPVVVRADSITQATATPTDGLSLDAAPDVAPAAADGAAARTFRAVRAARNVGVPVPEPTRAPDPPAQGTARPPATPVAPGGGNGRRVTFSVDVEAGSGLDLAAVTAVVEAALFDPRSWAAGFELQRVSPGNADVAVLVATPTTVDRLCARAGLNTAGIFSCWNGRTAALNLWRWNTGDEEFPDLATYRTYLVNHEVGHGLGFGHRGCPAAGSLAPVMMQQSRTTGACNANPWPYP